MLRVGLTGGIGSGKSEVADRLARRGAVIVDADVLAREVVAPGTPGLAAVVAEFGTEVLRADGSLDRGRLGELVFADDGRRAALNAIVHPLVGERAAQRFDSAPDDAVVVHVVPLLVENDLAGAYDVVVVVDVPVDVQLDRLTRVRGMSDEQARHRIAAQAGRTERLAAADVVIDNAGHLIDLDQRVDELWARLTARGERG